MRSNRTIVTLLLSSVLAAPSLAQDVPFTGIVVDDAVDVLAGAGRTFYVVGQVKRGALVTVDEVIFGWHKIVPPDGTFSYISKAFVNRQGDGSTGVVNQDHADVKAANVEPTGTSYRRQVELNKNDKVKIVGEQGDNYKIVPPKGAYVYLPPGAVRRATAQEISGIPAETTAVAPAATTAVVTPEPASAETAVPTSQTTVVDVAAKVQTTDEPVAVGPVAAVEPEQPQAMTVEPVATVPVAVSGPLNPTLIDLEKRFEEASQLPLEQQPIESLTKEYEALSARDDLDRSDRVIVAGRLRQLQRNAELAKALQEVAQVRQRVDEQRVEMLKPTAAQRQEQTTYAAVGQLLASSVYNGESLPRLLRLVDPATLRTITYVKPGSHEQLNALGRVVGVVGRTRYDPGLNLRLIDAQRIDVLAPAAAEAPADHLVK